MRKHLSYQQCSLGVSSKIMYPFSEPKLSRNRQFSFFRSLYPLGVRHNLLINPLYQTLPLLPIDGFLTSLRLFIEKVIVAYRPTLGHKQLQFKP